VSQRRSIEVSLALHHFMPKRLRTQNGQAVVEFVLVLPLLLLLMFVIVEFGRAWNVRNDLNQMAADGARMAAVGRYPGDDTLRQQSGDTEVIRTDATVTRTYPDGGTCNVGQPVTVTAKYDFDFLPFLELDTVELKGTATMRLEQAPDAC
jgi:Flp pilus assembly protein TadG